MKQITTTRTKSFIERSSRFANKNELREYEDEIDRWVGKLEAHLAFHMDGGYDLQRWASYVAGFDTQLMRHWIPNPLSGRDVYLDEENRKYNAVGFERSMDILDFAYQIGFSNIKTRTREGFETAANKLRSANEQINVNLSYMPNLNVDSCFAFLENLPKRELASGNINYQWHSLGHELGAWISGRHIAIKDTLRVADAIDGITPGEAGRMSILRLAKAALVAWQDEDRHGEILARLEKSYSHRISRFRNVEPQRIAMKRLDAAIRYRLLRWPKPQLTSGLDDVGSIQKPLAEADAARPSWSKDTGQLIYLNNECKLKIQNKNDRIGRILDSFQSAKWQRIVNNPYYQDDVEDKTEFGKVRCCLYHFHKKCDFLRLKATLRQIEWSAVASKAVPM